SWLAASFRATTLSATGSGGAGSRLKSCARAVAPQEKNAMTAPAIQLATRMAKAAYPAPSPRATPQELSLLADRAGTSTRIRATPGSWIATRWATLLTHGPRRALRHHAFRALLRVSPGDHGGGHLSLPQRPRRGQALRLLVRRDQATPR